MLSQFSFVACSSNASFFPLKVQTIKMTFVFFFFFQSDELIWFWIDFDKFYFVVKLAETRRSHMCECANAKKFNCDLAKLRKCEFLNMPTNVIQLLFTSCANVHHYQHSENVFQMPMLSGSQVSLSICLVQTHDLLMLFLRFRFFLSFDARFIHKVCTNWSRLWEFESSLVLFSFVSFDDKMPSSRNRMISKFGYENHRFFFFVFRFQQHLKCDRRLFVPFLLLLFELHRSWAAWVKAKKIHRHINLHMRNIVM